MYIYIYIHISAGIRLDVEWAEDAAWRRSHKEPYLSWTDFQTTRAVGWNRPFFTYILLFVCTVVMIASYGVNGWTIEPLSINPMIGPSAQTLIRMGAKQTSLIVEQGEWYRLFSPMVLHAGLIHYFLNMTALWFIGRAVEQCHGFAAAVILFIIPAVGGTILSAIFLSEYISVGASGGIFGLIGACIADICMNWSLLFSKHVNASDEGVRFRHMKVRFLLLLSSHLAVLTPTDSS
jgi:membrane associated rhomboid family serine protease